MKGIIVIKIGGSTFGSTDTTVEDLVTLQNRGIPLVVVHGGGALITDWLKKLGVATKFIRGERVTDLPSLKVVTAVLSGLVNKEITGQLVLKGGRAVGISGVDGALVESTVRDSELGYVGGVVRVNAGVLETLLGSGYIPVISPVSLAVAEPKGSPVMLNVNGDVIAGAIAAALKAERLIYLTDVDGVKDKSGAVIPHLTAKEAEALISSGVIAGGMIPKVYACLEALKVGSTARIIDGSKPHALLQEIEGARGGTTFSP